MGYPHTTISAAPVGDDNGLLTSVDMKVGAYTLDANAPTFGARHLTVKRTFVGTGDTPGTVILVGKGLLGETITETVVPGANTIVVPTTKWFTYLTSATGAGWVIDAAEGTKDTIEIGWAAENAIATGSGVLHAVVINTAAAGAISIRDATGIIATIPSNQAAGSMFEYEANWSGYLRVEPAAASNITILHSGSTPLTWA